MTPRLSSAVILAAGRGTRMGDLTNEIPKPMLLVHGRPMLGHVVERLATAGIARVLLVTGFRGELIEQYFALQTKPVVGFVSQNPVNGTGSAALLAREFVSQNPFLLTYGDILCDASEYSRAASLLAESEQTAAVIGVKAVDDPWQGAAVYEVNGQITRILEKPPKGTSTTPWNNAGVFAFRPIVFEYLARLTPSVRGEYELTSAIDAMLADRLDLRISPIEGAWRDVGRPEDLAAMNS